jgi:hypothetical protein
MAVSARREKARRARKERKEARMKRPGTESKYALKKKGVYPSNSPYLTGNWGDRMGKLTTTGIVETEERRAGLNAIVARYGNG